MALSRNAQTIMEELKAAYIAQGFPPRTNWWFQMPHAQASELEGEGLIESPQLDNYMLTEPGHQWVMSREGRL